MGEGTQFRVGQKAPNNGVYIEVGETGSNVNDPQQIKLSAGESFPENTNHNRIWVNKRTLSKQGVQG
ncbi:YjzC family protein [Oceanobacillus massiliensis]|uniref:YjzC family protein n=1 Tax=Oceanobacillus massiliensis TaxID=1465765 RepID=UPI000288386A|nr:YjzC family protein [Oceanobacillus massiliensis]